MMLKEGKMCKGGRNQKPEGDRPSRPTPRKLLFTPLKTELVASLRCPECREWTPLRKQKCGVCGYEMYTEKDIIQVRDAMRAQYEEFWRGVKPMGKVIDDGV